LVRWHLFHPWHLSILLVLLIPSSQLIRSILLDRSSRSVPSARLRIRLDPSIQWVLLRPNRCFRSNLLIQSDRLVQSVQSGPSILTTQ
jgi:hypothetical protein